MNMLPIVSFTLFFLRPVVKLIGLGLIVVLSMIIAPWMCCWMTDKREGNEDEETVQMNQVNQ